MAKKSDTKSASATPAPVVCKMPRRHNKSNGRANMPNGVACSEPKFAHLYIGENVAHGLIVKKNDPEVILHHNLIGKGWRQFQAHNAY